jgi:hypothetical protein
MIFPAAHLHDQDSIVNIVVWPEACRLTTSSWASASSLNQALRLWPHTSPLRHRKLIMHVHKYMYVCTHHAATYTSLGSQVLFLVPNTTQINHYGKAKALACCTHPSSMLILLQVWEPYVYDTAICIVNNWVLVSHTTRSTIDQPSELIKPGRAVKRVVTPK